MDSAKSTTGLAFAHTTFMTHRRIGLGSLSSLPMLLPFVFIAYQQLKPSPAPPSSRVLHQSVTLSSKSLLSSATWLFHAACIFAHPAVERAMRQFVSWKTKKTTSRS